MAALVRGPIWPSLRCGAGTRAGTYGVAGLKAALDLSGYNGGVPRPPLRSAPPQVVETIRRQLAELGAFKELLGRTYH